MHGKAVERFRSARFKCTEHTEAIQHPHAFRADEFGAGLVARKARAIRQHHLATRARQQDGRGGAGWPGADNQHIS
jgi:hypothetical protein